MECVSCMQSSTVTFSQYLLLDIEPQWGGSYKSSSVAVVYFLKASDSQTWACIQNFWFSKSREEPENLHFLQVPSDAVTAGLELTL